MPRLRLNAPCARCNAAVRARTSWNADCFASNKRRARRASDRGAHMTKKLLTTLGLSICLGLAAIGCGDDDDDDKNDVSIKAPGVDVKADGLTGAAGAAARGTATESRRRVGRTESFPRPTRRLILSGSSCSCWLRLLRHEVEHGQHEQHDHGGDRKLPEGLGGPTASPPW